MESSGRRLLRRRFLRAIGACLVLPVYSPSFATGVSLIALRFWPAEEYTRIILEFNNSLIYRYKSIFQPDRLFVDLEGIQMVPLLTDLTTKSFVKDPYIQGIRVGRYNHNTVRLVFDLKSEVKPQVFEVPPVGQYGYRIVIDLYPKVPRDPLLALWEQFQARQMKEDSTATQEKPILHEGVATRDGKAPLRSMLTIAIDPGHGGEDFGAIGASGAQEKQVVFAIAQRLKKRIESNPTMRCVLTRDGDYFVPLMGRVQKARAVKSDLFVSIHADAFIKPYAKGSSVFALSDGGATSAAAKWLAKKENEADLIGGVNTAIADPYLARTLFDLTQTATLKNSLQLANIMLKALGNMNSLHKNEVEQAGFAVLKAHDIPSILVETAFISNPEEEAKLKDSAQQERYANAIFNGISTYLKSNKA